MCVINITQSKQNKIFLLIMRCNFFHLLKLKFNVKICIKIVNCLFGFLHLQLLFYSV